MKIRLTIDLPINKNCGAFKGVVFTVIGKPKEISRGRLIYFIGKNGERCGAFSNEYEVVKDNQHICCICGQSYPESELERDFMVCDICKSEDRAIPTREDKNGKLFAAGDWLKKESSSEMTQVLRIQPNHIVCDPGGFIPTEEIDVWVIHEWIKTSYQYKIIEPRFNIGSPKLKYITPCKFQSGTMIGDCGCFGECKHHIDKNIIHDFVICELYNGKTNEQSQQRPNQKS